MTIDSTPPHSIRDDLKTLGRGLCMGAADIVPGVSGGTVALILGHYNRLVTALSRLDLAAMGLLKNREFAAFARRIDLRFLAVLVVGMLTGILSLASLMHWLLENRFSETMAVFFGLILASSVLVGKMIPRWSIGAVFAAILGGALAWSISAMSPTTATLTFPYIFVAANVAICAMILPGISGAFVLLLLGVYHPITGLLRDLAHGQWTLVGILQLLVFTTGCATGLIAFSRLLRMLLERLPSLTFAALLGLMVGSLRKLWPFQRATAETHALELKDRVFEVVSPAVWEGSLLTILILILVSVAIVFALHWLGIRFRDRLQKETSAVSTTESTLAASSALPPRG